MGLQPSQQADAGERRRLEPVWSFATGVPQGHEAPPLVNDGVMFVATPQNQVLAIDAAPACCCGAIGILRRRM